MVTANEKADVNFDFDYRFEATNLQSSNLVAFNLTEKSLHTDRYNLFDVDTQLFEVGEYLYKIIQIDNDLVVETGKLEVIDDSNNDVFFQ